jgi:hypothetical protein
LIVEGSEKGEKFLLKHSYRNHHHAELRTYYLYKEWMEKEFEKNTFLPFTKCNYEDPVGRSEKPYVYLDGFEYHDSTYAMNIFYSSSGYELKILFSRDSNKKTSDLFCEIDRRRDVLGMEFKKKSEGYDSDLLLFSGYKTMEDVKDRIKEICRFLKTLNEDEKT